MPRTVWNRFFIGMALITSLALLIWIAGANVVAQSTYSATGLRPFLRKTIPRLHLNLERRSGNPAGTRWDKALSFQIFRD